MNWLDIINQLFQTLLPVAMAAISVTLIYYITNVVKSSKIKTDNELAIKYLDMLEDTITKAVLATTQTYVENMKNKNAFDKEAQKTAFDMTYNAVMKVLTDDVKVYLEQIVGDLDTYITAQIEATVKLAK